MKSTKQLGDLVIGIEKQIKAKIERDLKQYGVGVGLLQILLIFFSNKSNTFSQIDLVKLLKIDKGNISRSIAKLVDRGYLEQEPDMLKMYRLSKEGLLLEDEILSKFTKLNKTMMVGIDEAKLNITTNTLAKVLKNLEDIK